MPKIQINQHHPNNLDACLAKILERKPLTRLGRFWILLLLLSCEEIPWKNTNYRFLWAFQHEMSLECNGRLTRHDVSVLQDIKKWNQKRGDLEIFHQLHVHKFCRECENDTNYCLRYVDSGKMNAHIWSRPFKVTQSTKGKSWFAGQEGSVATRSVPYQNAKGDRALWPKQIGRAPPLWPWLQLQAKPDALLVPLQLLDKGPHPVTSSSNREDKEAKQGRQAGPLPRSWWWIKGRHLPGSFACRQWGLDGPKRNWEVLKPSDLQLCFKNGVPKSGTSRQPFQKADLKGNKSRKSHNL